ncbi:winged helix-turn-helix domain-containing protein [Microbispora camponoti]|uniref:Winged helix-turn-helix domain-containing protein n=1 Tax=Microbispora bryophytorum subsp. camponoti TaxID=1677852 RepID=A0ABR8L232_9ACTN|nr:winged helix-turn-helix domain-containing protein [Microbispora camponoti]
MQGDTPGVGMSFAVLGPLDVRRDGQPVEVGGRRLRALLTLLLLDAGRTVSTEALVAGVWDDRPPSGVGNALQALVSRLRATVGRGLVVGEPSGYRLAVSPDQVDLHRFARLAGEGAAALAAGDPGRAAGLLREALGLWRGAPLTDLPDAEVEVARLEGLRIAAAEDRIEAELALGRHADLITELRLLVTAHPLRERPHGQLMRALYGSGRGVEALAAYEEARSVFADLLGTDPSPALAGLHLAMLRGEAPEEGTRPSPEVTPRGLAQVEQGLAPVDGPSPRAARRGNLRARLTSFVGRDDDVGRIGGLLAADRLVTLLGPGGAGKTRLAVESAEAIAARMPDGVWLVELAPVGDAAEVPQAALTALGLRDTGLVPVRAAPAMPSAPGGESDPVARLVSALAARDTLIVLDNCEHVIEPAAARLRMMSAGQIAERLGDRFRLFTGGSRTAVPRHQTLRAVVEWSWDLFDAGERALAARLATPARCGAARVSGPAVGGTRQPVGGSQMGLRGGRGGPRAAPGRRTRVVLVAVRPPAGGRPAVGGGAGPGGRRWRPRAAGAGPRGARHHKCGRGGEAGAGRAEPGGHGPLRARHPGRRPAPPRGDRGADHVDVLRPAAGGGGSAGAAARTSGRLGRRLRPYLPRPPALQRGTFRGGRGRPGARARHVQDGRRPVGVGNCLSVLAETNVMRGDLRPVSPMSERTWCARRTTSNPDTRAPPPSGRTSVARIRTAVVFPAPLGPRTPRRRPCGTSRSTPSSALVSPYRFARPSAWIA